MVSYAVLETDADYMCRCALKNEVYNNSFYSYRILPSLNGKKSQKATNTALAVGLQAGFKSTLIQSRH